MRPWNRFRPGPARRRAGFTLIEILFAIAILGVGIVGILALFVSGISAANWAGKRSSAAMQAQSLYARILAQDDGAGKRLFLERLKSAFFHDSGGGVYTWPNADGDKKAVYIQDVSTVVDPVRVADGSDYWWKCRATNYIPVPDATTGKFPDPDSTGATVTPAGLVRLEISVYRYSGSTWSGTRDPISVYSTLLTLEYP